MRPGAIVAVLLSVVGLTAVVFAFMSNASPYVTVREARVRKGDNMHLSGDIVPGTLRSDVRAGVVSFDVKDEEGQTAKVLYQGPPPANMGTATKVVAIGGMKDGVFHSEKLLLKCPSKYETKA